MNTAEALAREIMRVTELREVYRGLDGQPNVIVKPALMMMDAALEGACVASGTNDAVAVIQAYNLLKGFEK